METTLHQQIERARELLRTARHAAMATVNSDGSPHNSPFLFMHDDRLTTVYWGSHPASQHSQNVVRSGQLFVVLYDTIERGGLFLRCTVGHILEGDELETGLAIHNQVRSSRHQESLPIDYYRHGAPQRMWSARIRQLWVNGTTRDPNGHIIRDIRTEISATDLIA